MCVMNESLFGELFLVESRAGWPVHEAYRRARADLAPWVLEEDEVDLGQLGGPQDCAHSACTYVPAK